MQNIIFDCERMKYPNTGLYHYCLNLGKKIPFFINKTKENITYFIPPHTQRVFGTDKRYLIQHPLHKFLLPDLNGFDLWHCTFQGSHYLPMLNKKISVVLTIHDLNFLYDDRKSEKKKNVYLARQQTLVDRADAIICVSEFTRKDVETHLDRRDTPIYVIYNGTNHLEKPVLSKNTYKPSKPFLFSIGVMNRKKNYHSLLPLLQHNADLELVISGRIDDVEYYHDILSQAKQLKVIDQVKMTGQISEPEKSWYYKNCNAFVFPSKAEGFGLPVTEAMSVGKPVFLSDMTASSEIGGKAAFYFSDITPGNISDQYHEGMRQYKNIGMKETIKLRAKDFSWQKAAAAYAEIYRSLS